MAEGVPEENKNKVQWEGLAEKYGQEVLGQRYVLWPGVHEAINISEGDRVLDVGSGDGSYAKSFLESGAAEVVALEPAENFMELARQNNPGPTYLQTTIEEYRENSRFNKILANMVLCNFSSEEQMRAFFERTATAATDDGHLFVTNMAPTFQRTITTDYMSHEYPEEVVEGSPITVSLNLASGGTIGPFDNYHWSPKLVTSVAREAGWKLVESPVLDTVEEDANNPALCILFKFKKSD